MVAEKNFWWLARPASGLTWDTFKAFTEVVAIPPPPAILIQYHHTLLLVKQVFVTTQPDVPHHNLFYQSPNSAEKSLAVLYF